MTQPEALRLADELLALHGPTDIDERAAAELRRLHASCEDYAQHKQRQDQRILKLYAQRDALLEALKLIVEFVDAPAEGKRPDVFVMRISKARAAIKKAEE